MTKVIISVSTNQDKPYYFIQAGVDRSPRFATAAAAKKAFPQLLQTWRCTVARLKIVNGKKPRLLEVYTHNSDQSVDKVKYATSGWHKVTSTV